MCKLSPVAFHGDTIFCVDYHGEPYIPMKPIVENMSLAWQTQARKFLDNKKRWGITIMVIPTEGGEQKTLCMPLRKFPAWLASINPKKVRPELRAKIELYQAESDDALWNYWMNGRAERKITSGAIFQYKDKYEAYMEEVEAFRAKTFAGIDELLKKGLDLVDVYKFGPGGIIGFSPILLDWLQSVAGRHTPLVSDWQSMDRAIEYSPLCLMKQLESWLPDLKK